MVVLEVEVDDFPAFDAEGDAPVAADGEAPGPFAVARELMRAPALNGLQGGGARGVLQEGQDVDDLRDECRREACRVVVCHQLPQSAVSNASDVHKEGYQGVVWPDKRHFTTSSLVACSLFDPAGGERPVLRPDLVPQHSRMPSEVKDAKRRRRRTASHRDPRA